MKRELAVFAFFLALATAFTWPLLLHLDTAAADRGDPLLTTWIIDWVSHALTHAPLHLYDGPIYYPGRFPIAYSENLIGIAIVMLPLHLAGLSPLTIHNLALILGYAFSAYGAYVLARLITRHTFASLLGGIFFAFGSFMVAHVQHVQIVWSGWLPLLLAALLVYWRTPTTRQAALLAAVFVMNGLTNVYWLLYGGFMLAVTIAFLQLADSRRDRAFWLRLMASLAIAGLVLVPVLLPYQIVSHEYRLKRTTGESRGGSASFIDWLAPSSRNVLYGPLADPKLHRDERELFPGVLVILLAVYALCVIPSVSEGPGRAAREARASSPTHPGPSLTLGMTDWAILACATATWLTTIEDKITLGNLTFQGPDVPAMLTVILLIIRFLPQLQTTIHQSRFTKEQLTAALWIVVGFIASLGWNAFLHPFLFRVLTPFRATRTPARWAIIVYVGLAVWAAMGAAALLERTKRKRLVGALLLAFAILETRPRIKWEHVNAQRAPVYAWLARERPGVVLELPILAHGVPYEYILATTVHRVPIMNGASGWETPLHRFLREKERKLEYDDAFLDAVLRNGAKVVIVHERRLTPEQKTALAPMLGKLAPLRRFGSDAVFNPRR